MRFEWDPEKARTNLVKHGISFEIATLVWADEGVELLPDNVYDGEERWLAIGRVDMFTGLVVVHVQPDEETIRIISARRATPRERREHDEPIFQP